MRKWFVLFAITGLAACGGGGGGGGSTGGLAPGLAPDPGGSSGGGGGGACSVDGQKQTVLDLMRFWYLWNADLPAFVDLSQFATPEDVLDHLASFRPDGVPQFSFLTTAEADQAFFGEGQYEGFGFGYRLVTDDEARITRVFADSPAGLAGLARGQRILTLNGETITVEVVGQAVLVKNDAEMTSLDVAADNGYIHVINKVLIPTSTTTTTGGGTTSPASALAMSWSMVMATFLTYMLTAQ